MTDVFPRVHSLFILNILIGVELYQSRNMSDPITGQRVVMWCVVISQDYDRVADDVRWLINDFSSVYLGIFTFWHRSNKWFVSVGASARYSWFLSARVLCNFLFAKISSFQQLAFDVTFNVAARCRYVHAANSQASICKPSIRTLGSSSAFHTT